MESYQGIASLILCCLEDEKVVISNMQDLCFHNTDVNIRSCWSRVLLLCFCFWRMQPDTDKLAELQFSSSVQSPVQFLPVVPAFEKLCKVA